jgi:hypothetical protein
MVVPRDRKSQSACRHGDGWFQEKFLTDLRHNCSDRLSDGLE